MDQLETLRVALEQLRSVVAGLDESQMESPTNCEPMDSSADGEPRSQLSTALGWFLERCRDRVG